MDRFLRAKHWQLFLLLFAIPMLFQTILMATVFVSMANNSIPDVSFMLTYIQFFPVVMLLVMSVYFGWFWAVGVGLQKKVPENVTMKVSRFKLFLLIPVVYLMLILLFVISMFRGMLEGGSTPDPAIFAIIFPLHLFSIFCIFYCLHFVAKTFKTVELQREVVFSDFAGEFFMMWFYPIGIWIIQPKINKIAES